KLRFQSVEDGVTKFVLADVRTLARVDGNTVHRGLEEPPPAGPAVVRVQILPGDQGRLQGRVRGGPDRPDRQQRGPEAYAAGQGFVRRPVAAVGRGRAA